MKMEHEKYLIIQNIFSKSKKEPNFTMEGRKGRRGEACNEYASRVTCSAKLAA